MLGPSFVAHQSRKKIQFDLDVFNALNTNSATTITQASGTSFGAISTIVPPRILKIGATFAF